MCSIDSANSVLSFTRPGFPPPPYSSLLLPSFSFPFTSSLFFTTIYMYPYFDVHENFDLFPLCFKRVIYFHIQLVTEQYACLRLSYYILYLMFGAFV